MTSSESEPTAIAASSAAPAAVSVRTEPVRNDGAASGREDDAKKRLIDAAGPVFAERGFEKATIREICGEAGVNIAAVGYYFGDKFGLYREVIRQIRQRCQAAHAIELPSDLDAKQALHFMISRLLAQMVSRDDSAWETQVMMREMNRPTEVFTEMVEETFRPTFNRLASLISKIAPSGTPVEQIERLTLTVIGDCLHYRVGAAVVRQMIPEPRRSESFDVASLARHITGVIIAAAEHGLAKQHADSLTHI